MRLHYYKDLLGNFGDDLNPHLWRRVMPELLDDDPRTLLIGIGTNLTESLPAEARKVVVGAGTGYGPPPHLDHTWDIRFVRGPLTAQALGLSMDKAITDPAILIAHLNLWRESRPLRGGHHRVVFLPHHCSARFMDWREVCDEAGLSYVDPTWSPRKVISRIWNATLVISEAMHGAIVADACRVPWIGVAIYPHINHFKWKDWHDSMELNATLHRIPPLLDGWARRRWRNRALGVRAAWRLRKLWPLKGLEIANLPAVAEPADATHQMARALHTLSLARPVLSKDSVHSDRLSRVVDAVEELRRSELARSSS